MMSRFVRRILGVPLVAKLIGANVIIVASAFAVQTTAVSHLTREEIVIGVIALAAAAAVNVYLVRLALRPVDELEKLAVRVTEGEFDARGAPSPYADKDLSRLGETINSLLDSLAREPHKHVPMCADTIVKGPFQQADVLDSRSAFSHQLQHMCTKAFDSWLQVTNSPLR